MSRPAEDSTGAAGRVIVRLRIRSSPEQLFEAWTCPEALLQWWGPRGVECTGAEVDLRVGGSYRLENRLPGGQMVTIRGVFERIEAGRELVFTWSVRKDGGPASPFEKVTVQFVPSSPAATETEVTVIHDRIPSLSTAEEHQLGWIGCLERLDGYVWSRSSRRQIDPRRR